MDHIPLVYGLPKEIITDIIFYKKTETMIHYHDRGINFFDISVNNLRIIRMSTDLIEINGFTSTKRQNADDIPLKQWQMQTTQMT